MRLPVSFDLTDPKQKAAYDILKNAGYGKRTPTIVDALLNSLQSVPESVSLEQRPSSTELRNVIEEAVETALRKYQLSGSAVQTPEPQVSVQDVVEGNLLRHINPCLLHCQDSQSLLNVPWASRCQNRIDRRLPMEIWMCCYLWRTLSIKGIYEIWWFE